MTYLLNTWYAAGFPSDFSAQPVARTLLERPLVLYRTETGKPVALDDRCPHRFAPLHLGKVFGEDIRCQYHGLRYGPGGQCVHNPIGEGRIPKAAVTRSYPLAEVDGIVWIWFGDQEADPSLIRRWPQFESADFATVQGTLHVQANYQMVSDNLLDLSHAEFLHPTLATEGFNRRTQYSMTQEGSMVVARNWRPSEPITQVWAMAYPADVPERVDHRAIVRWLPPAVIELEVGVTRPGEPDAAGPTSYQAHLVTPEHEGSSHYFWKFARDFRIDDAAFSTRLQAAIQDAFENEDEPMIEAQYRCMNGQTLESLKPVLLPTDAASMRARRVLQQLISAQAAAAVATAPAAAAVAAPAQVPPGYAVLVRA
ncbi:MAG: aromatic ring-hydroxylating dioxygenase subunit alpha [Comamonadaceae bacterium]|nr:MAG: aromatic ring-hydroxylating dioxygenase subunit alpha [Comamonadaceae bacterium]